MKMSVLFEKEDSIGKKTINIVVFIFYLFIFAASSD